MSMKFISSDKGNTGVDDNEHDYERQERERKQASIADNIRSWLVALATICGVFGAMAYWQISANDTGARTAEDVAHIQIDITELRKALDGLPQIVHSIQEQLRDQAGANAVQTNQINLLANDAAAAKVRIDNLERAGNTKLR